MDIAAILALIEKGLAVISALASAGQPIGQAIEAISNLASKGKSGTATPADLESTEAVLDGIIDDFNLPLDG